MTNCVGARLPSAPVLLQVVPLVNESKRRLMIVDGHAETRGLIRDLLGELADAICECANGEEAVDRCEEFKPDFVTLDAKLATMNGLETAQTILARWSTEIVLVTESVSAELRRAAMRVGATGCFSKNNLAALRRHFETAPHGSGQL